MIFFAIGFFGIVFLTLLLQIVTKMKLVGGNELGIVSGRKAEKGFRYISGGRIIVFPLVNKFSKLELTPYTIEVIVDSAIAAGIIPLNVKATVSFGIASNNAGRMRAATRILDIAYDKENLKQVASDIIEGHLRDAIASMTPEQVMQNKDILVTKMINVCKSDLENIGLEITTMNIADVDDHRLEGVKEPDLYIALLKRVQTVNAETKAREARALASAASIEEQENRRSETTVRSIENEYQELLASTKVNVEQENQRRIIGIKQAEQSALAEVAGTLSEIESQKHYNSMLEKKYEAEIVTPALAEREKMKLVMEKEIARINATAQAEIDELKKTLEIINKGGEAGKDAYLIENFKKLIVPFAETLDYFPVKKLSVITGIEGSHAPISAIHPSAVSANKNELIDGIFREVIGKSEKENMEANLKNVTVKHDNVKKDKKE